MAGDIHPHTGAYQGGGGTLRTHSHPHTHLGLHPHNPNIREEGGRCTTSPTPQHKALLQGVGTIGGRRASNKTPPLTTGLAALGLYNAAIHDFTAALQGVVAMGVVAAFTSPSLVAPMEKVRKISLLHLRFVCGVVGDGDLLPIWKAVARVRRRKAGFVTLYQALMRGL